MTKAEPEITFSQSDSTGLLTGDNFGTLLKALQKKSIKEASFINMNEIGSLVTSSTAGSGSSGSGSSASGSLATGSLLSDFRVAGNGMLSRSGRPLESCVHEYFEHLVQENCCICKVETGNDTTCGRVIPGKVTSNLKEHLRRHHCQVYAEVQRRDGAKRIRRDTTRPYNVPKYGGVPLSLCDMPESITNSYNGKRKMMADTWHLDSLLSTADSATHESLFGGQPTNSAGAIKVEPEFDMSGEQEGYAGDPSTSSSPMADGSYPDCPTTPSIEATKWTENKLEIFLKDPETFWTSLCQLGLFPDIARDLLHELSLLFYPQASIERVQENSFKLSRAVEMFGLQDRLYDSLRARYCFAQAQTNALATEVEDLKKKAAEQERRQREMQRKSDLLSHLIGGGGGAPDGGSTTSSEDELQGGGIAILSQDSPLTVEEAICEQENSSDEIGDADKEDQELAPDGEDQ